MLVRRVHLRSSTQATGAVVAQAATAVAARCYRGRSVVLDRDGSDARSRRRQRQEAVQATLFKMESMLDIAPMERAAGTIDVQMVHCQRSHSSLTLAYT